MKSSFSSIYIIAGPTASGKSRLALELAEHIKGEIINADSIQGYRDLRVLTARPSEAKERRAPHHGYGILSPYEMLSAGQWRQWAERQIQEIQARNKPIFVVGGTGLYLKSLTQGLLFVPAIDPAIRKAFQLRKEIEGLQSLYDELQQKDPMSAQKVAPQDSQRIIRALEVLLATGRALHEWQAQPTASPAFNFKTILLLPDKGQLVERANERLSKMITEGALEEVRELVLKGIPVTAPIFRALGAVPLYEYLQQRLSLEEAIIKTQNQTRQYIKRQYTWFRHQITANLVLDWADLQMSVAELWQKICTTS
jgi:tRNA dimethylallyltransferase